MLELNPVEYAKIIVENFDVDYEAGFASYVRGINSAACVVNFWGNLRALKQGVRFLFFLSYYPGPSRMAAPCS
jgi:hypothetical protein